MTGDRDPHNERLTVLIVDADWRVRRDLAAFVALRPGVRVAGATGDLAGAMSLVTSARPDLVVVDPKLPDLATGLAFIAWVRQTSTAKVVALSNEAAVELPACATGADDFALKSGQTAALLDAIQRAARFGFDQEPADTEPASGGADT